MPRGPARKNGGQMSGNAKPAAKSKSGTAGYKPDDPPQYKRFLEAAREAEADESEEEADRAFKKIALSKKVF
jgi:hypothetical protein